ncbi:unnamed protein product [Chironomus riparius]|uniref:GB1/RHD3-type G domain-containing protein n=1 Tax=Chironomus riparius TaxID=315576 RepID=A0A9N9S7M9_9DIPT|nr:unnamed protein product [Chironomus riparius]
MSSHNHPYGKSENVLGFGEDSKVFIKEEPLKDMFLHPDVKHRKIVAFSIIGAYRKGKSFFLDYCLRYLYAHYPSINYPNNPVSNPTNWMGEEDEPLNGFLWRPGTIRITTGLEVWNDIFLHTDEKSGEEIAIFVMDTHGLFDSETSSLDNSRIFSLGTLISSIEVLNLSGVIQDDQLQFLQFSTECAKFATIEQQGTADKCFQNLIFLIRDWDNPDEFQYGIEGGSKYLKHFIEVTGRKKKELKYVCESIIDSFENINCSLLTHPGKIVSRGKKGTQEYDGNWKGMDEDFRDQLFTLIDYLLKPEQLAVKKINGNETNGEDFLSFILTELKDFQTDDLLKSQTLRDLMTEKEMEALISFCIEHYKEVGNRNKGTIQNDEDIPKLHEQCKKEALDKYDSSKKMGNDVDSKRFRRVLEERIEQLFTDLIVQLENDKKKLEDETEKLRSELDERQKKELEKIEHEKKLAEERLEAGRKKAKEALEHEAKLKEEEIVKINKQAEQEQIAAQQQREEQVKATKTVIEAIHETVAESKQQHEDNKKKELAMQEEKEMEQIQSMDHTELKDNSSFGDESNSDDPITTSTTLKQIEPLRGTNKEDIEKWKQDLFLKNSLATESSKTMNDDKLKLEPLDVNSQFPSLHTATVAVDATKPGRFPITHKADQEQFKNPNVKDKVFEQFQDDPVPMEPFCEAAQDYSIREQSLTPVSHAEASDFRAHPLTPQKEPRKVYAAQPTTPQNRELYGKNVKILAFPSNNNPSIDDEFLRSIFEHPEVRDRKIVVFSIAGTSSRENNKLLSYFLNYLYILYTSLQKFSSPIHMNYSAQDGDDSALFMWNDVFLHENYRTDDKVAIILMTTQGLFDDQKTPKDNARSFAIGMLISSTQVLNLSKEIHTNQLKNLDDVAKFAEIVAAGSQRIDISLPQLVFLIRNWSNEKYSYGMTGGNDYLTHLLSPGMLSSIPLLNKESKSIREMVRNSFKNSRCVLLPRSLLPGSHASSSRSQRKQSSSFEMEMKNLVENLFHSENLMPKIINGVSVTGRELYSYIKVYFEHFKSEMNSQPSNRHNHLNMIAQIEMCFEQYKVTVYKNKDVISSPENIAKLHKMSKDSAINMFYGYCDKIGYVDNDMIYTRELEKKIEDIYSAFQNPSDENIEEFEKESQKIEALLQEKQKMEENFAVEKQILTELSEIKIANAKLECEKRILQVKLEHEQKFSAVLESKIDHLKKSGSCEIM